MNDLMRLVDRALRPFGYGVRHTGSVNLLPAEALFEPVSLSRLREQVNYGGEDKGDVPPDLNRVRILYRICLRRTRLATAGQRIGGLTLDEIARVCFKSLVSSINHAMASEAGPTVELTIIDDGSDQDLLDAVLAHAGKIDCPWSIVQPDTSGQGGTLLYQFKLARRENALCYFCEDDYLHEENAIYELWRFYNQAFEAADQHCTIHPQEHADAYRGFYGPCYLFLGADRHWRSINVATHTLFLHSHVVDRYWRYFENTRYVGSGWLRQLGSERRTTMRLLKHIPCFSPIPALAVHFQHDATLPPYFDWRGLWAKNS